VKNNRCASASNYLQTHIVMRQQNRSSSDQLSDYNLT